MIEHHQRKAPPCAMLHVSVKCYSSPKRTAVTQHPLDCTYRWEERLSRGRVVSDQERECNFVVKD